MRDVLDRLSGGDLRSIGAADEVAREAVADSTLVPVLFAGINAEDPVMRMRCADALEKATRLRPEYLQPYARQLRALLTPSQPKEVLWHILQMTPRIAWRKSQREAVFRTVERCLSNSSSIVKTCAMQAIAELARQFPQHLGRAESLLRELSASGTPAMRSRGPKLLRKLSAAHHRIERRVTGRPVSAAHVKR